MRELDEALLLDSKSFEKRYGASKLEKEEQIIFSCKSGVRSEAACSIASQLGFKNVKNYSGSAMEWFDL